MSPASAASPRSLVVPESAVLPTLRHALDSLACWRRFRPGALIVRAGNAAETVYIMGAGQVRAFVLREDGDEVVTGVLGPGQVFGVAALLGREAYHAFAEALTVVDVWAVPRERLLERLADDPTLLGLVLAALARRLALIEVLFRDVALLPVAQRIPDVLARLSACLGGEQPRLSHEHLAALVGARRETVSRAVGTLAGAPPAGGARTGRTQATIA